MSLVVYHRRRDRMLIVRVIRTRDAKKFLDKYKRVDIAIDAFYNDPSEFSAPPPRHTSTSMPSTSRLHTLFSKYKGQIKRYTTRWLLADYLYFHTVA